MRSAPVASDSIDCVVTSPPYSVALDYVQNDEHALEAMGVSPARLRDRMSGTRGGTLAERLELYGQDLRAMLVEVCRVLRPGGRAAFVVGDATVSGHEGTTARDLGLWASAAGLESVFQLRKCVHGLYNVMKDEHILVFRKGGPGS